MSEVLHSILNAFRCTGDAVDISPFILLRNVPQPNVDSAAQRQETRSSQESLEDDFSRQSTPVHRPVENSF